MHGITNNSNGLACFATAKQVSRWWVPQQLLPRQLKQLSHWLLKQGLGKEPNMCLRAYHCDVMRRCRRFGVTRWTSSVPSSYKDLQNVCCMALLYHKVCTIVILTSLLNKELKTITTYLYGSAMQ